MKYLGSEYRLSVVDKQTFKRQATRAGLLKLDNDLEGTIKALTSDEDPTLAGHILMQGDMIHEAYRDGGALYALAFGVGIAALRKTNPLPRIPAIDTAEDWDRLVERDKELRARPGFSTLEEEAGIGLLEVRAVNNDYVDGYQEAFYTTPWMIQRLGFTSLGALNAHDLMHFASTRQED